MPKKGSAEGEEQEEDSGANQEEEKKFESTYLDKNLIKEKKKANKDASRIMKLMLTDGLNEMEAIEFERLKNMEYFNIGQKLMLSPPLEVRRGIILLNNQNCSYLGSPIKSSGTTTPTGNPGTSDPPKKAPSPRGGKSNKSPQ